VSAATIPAAATIYIVAMTLAAYLDLQTGPAHAGSASGLATSRLT
jgi:hypothetical protein